MPIRRDKNSDKTKANKENKSYIKILWLFKHIFMYMLLLLSYFSRVRLCVTPQTAAHQAPPSLAFSRQEHWSGLPFPSPTQESEKWKGSHSVVSNSLQPHGLQPTRLLHPWDFPGKSARVGCHCLLQFIYIHICKWIHMYIYMYIHSYLKTFWLFFFTHIYI